ncbi:MAG: UbiD family decarboxylase [Chloroflexi bacterium]|nr:UbiD family decarboxylase [Chloroflexota bacterium]
MSTVSTGISNDLREHIDRAKQLGECKLVEGADWDLEIGAITELQLSAPDQPMLLFDNIKGYPRGYRIASNFLNSAKLVALGFGLPLESRGLAQVQAWRDKIKKPFKLIPPVEVAGGPVLENVLTGKDVDLYKFPSPKWHELDGGRYLGTGDMVITRDPDTGWINAGTYRVQVHDRNIATIFMCAGRHGNLTRQKYWDKGQPCPVAVVCGGDPLLWSMARSGLPWGVSEYDYAGWLRDEPVEVLKGPVTGLPVPAGAEIVLEGEIVPPGGETRIEGPFGEWPGYYCTGSREEPVFRVKSILHRDNPIVLGAPPQIGPYDYYYGYQVMRAAQAWNALEENVPEVKGVWLPPEARGPLMVIASIKQKYAGHAKHAALFLSGYYQTAWLSRFIIVVDDDIDPTNMTEVIWALTTRCDPATSIDILRGCWSNDTDPMLSPEARRSGDWTNSKGIIIACKPFSWREDFPPSCKASPELLEKTRQKWGKLLFDRK